MKDEEILTENEFEFLKFIYTGKMKIIFYFNYSVLYIRIYYYANLDPGFLIPSVHHPDPDPGGERKGKGRRFCLGGRISSIPCHLP